MHFFSMLADKDIVEVIKLMNPVIDEWHIVPLKGSRGIQLSELKQRFIDSSIETKLVSHNGFSDACQILEKHH